MNKVTMQDIADALGISRVTVWKVFNNYTNVSASVRAVPAQPLSHALQGPNRALRQPSVGLGPYVDGQVPALRSGRGS